MGPLDAVKVLAGKYQDTAGVVEKVEKNRLGEVTAVTVDLDVDHERATFAPSDLLLLKTHGA